MQNKNIIYAVGIYKGGGLQVLKEFIISGKDFYFYFDSRLNPIHFAKIKNYKVVKQSLKNILLLNLKLRKKKTNIFYVNGIPPLLKMEGNIFVLYQNLNIFPPRLINQYFSWLFSYDYLRYLFFKIGFRNVQTWFVLSDEAKKALHQNLKNYNNIVKLFFFEININNKVYKKKYDFIYPADLKKHKNHNKIIDVLLSLSKKNLKPSFLFTLNNDEKKKLKFEKLQKKINIHNFIEFDNRNKFIRKMRQAKCLFFPSENETIGLPIIEAYNNNLIIATSNELFAKQFIEPDILFNYKSLKSMENAMKNIYQNKVHKKNNNIIRTFDSFLKKEEFFNFINE